MIRNYFLRTESIFTRLNEFFNYFNLKIGYFVNFKFIIVYAFQVF